MKEQLIREEFNKQDLFVEQNKTEHKRIKKLFLLNHWLLQDGFEYCPLVKGYKNFTFGASRLSNYRVEAGILFHEIAHAIETVHTKPNRLYADDWGFNLKDSKLSNSMNLELRVTAIQRHIYEMVGYFGYMNSLKSMESYKSNLNPYESLMFDKYYNNYTKEQIKDDWKLACSIISEYKKHLHSQKA